MISTVIGESTRSTAVFTSSRKRLEYIDNLRVIACFLVVLTHSTMPSINNPISCQILSFIGSPSSELFLALSGAVLLPVCPSFRVFYRRRFIKLYPPLIVWSIFGVALYTQTHGISWLEACNSIIRIPFQPAIPIFWFVYTMIGLYLLAPFISPWLKMASQRQVELFLFIWIINMTAPWVLYFYPGISTLHVTNGDYYWEFYYFGGFLGYWILGHYLKKYPIQIGLNVKWMSVLLGTCIYPVILIYQKHFQGRDVSALMDNLQIGSAILVAFIFTIMQNIKLSQELQIAVSKIARYSFCIYLIHIYIAREFFWVVFRESTIHVLPRTLLIASLTMLTSYLLAYILSYMPMGRYITGCSTNPTGKNVPN